MATLNERIGSGWNGDVVKGEELEGNRECRGRVGEGKGSIYKKGKGMEGERAEM